MDSDGIFKLINLGLSVAQDLTMAQNLKRVEDAQRQLLIAEAKNNRKKSNAVIMAIMKLDLEINKMEQTYALIKDSMGDKGQEVMDLIVNELEKERKRLVKKKKEIN